MSLPVPADRRPIDRVLAKLKSVKAAGSDRWMALCPTHDDAQRSLSVRVGADAKVVMYCHAGCSVPAIVAALGLSMTDLFSGPSMPPRSASLSMTASAPSVKAQGVTTRPKLTKTYDYHDADGTLLYQVCRFEPKTFRQRRPDGSGNWVWGMGDVVPVPYRLPQLIDAANQERRVFIVEGEKDADALAELGYPATTSPMGAGKWRESYSDHLAGCDVVILPDNDEPGRAHAEQIAASLTSRKAFVKVVALPNLPEKGDVSDWLATGDWDALEDLIGKTPRWTADGMNSRRTRWRLDELWENDSIMRPPPPIVPRLAWAGRSTLLAAREKSGKSTLTGYIAAQVTRGGTFLGDPCASGDVLIVGLEEFLGDAARRFRHFGADATRVHLVDSFLGEPRTRPQELLGHIDAVDPVLVILDSLAAYSAGQVQDDNNATQMSSVVQPLTDMAHTRGVALMIVHHARKADGRSRGSTAITAGTDVVCEFFCPDENTDPTLRRMRTIGRVPVQPVYDIRFDGDHYSPANGLDAPIEARILAAVASRPGISKNDAAEAVGGRRDTALKVIEDMLAKRTLGNLSDSMSRARLIVPEQSQPAFLREDP
jgi:5S rRNA maturation endonuclease (ribonuclease M5)